MKASRVTGPHKIGLTNVATPVRKSPNDVKVQIHYVAICADDVLSYAKGLVGSGVGHEFSGVIVEAGSEAVKMGFQIGDRVSGLPWMFCGRCPFCLYDHQNTIRFHLPTMYMKEVSILTSYMAPYLLDRTMQVLPQLNLEMLYSEPYPFAKIEEAFEMAYSQKAPRIYIDLTK